VKRLTDLQDLRRSQAKIDGHYALVERADGERLALMEMSSASGFSPVRGDDRVLRAGTQLGPVNCSPTLPAKAILAGQSAGGPVEGGRNRSKGGRVYTKHKSPTREPVEGGRVYTKHKSPTRKRDSFVLPNVKRLIDLQESSEISSGD